jgi:hypothetical protein
LNKDLIADLLSAGIRVPDSITGRKGGAGPAEGRAFLLNDLAVNIPIAAAYVADSPFQLRSHGEGYTLLKNGTDMGSIGIQHYERAWKKAVALFGPNQVSSFLIAGLGESPASIVWGSEVLADMGVYPFVVPFRPIPGSGMENNFINYLLSARSEIIDLLNTYTIESVYCSDLI